MTRKTDSGGNGRRGCEEIADALVKLYEQPFGGRTSGKYRVSRKFLRQIAGRRHLSSQILNAITEEMYERGFAFIDLETYFAVIDQRQFNGFRRLTSAATESVVGGSGGG